MYKYKTEEPYCISKSADQLTAVYDYDPEQLYIAKQKLRKKKVVACICIVAVIIITTIVTLCVFASSESIYEKRLMKAGYQTEVLDSEDLFELDELDARWGIIGFKTTSSLLIGSDFVYVVNFKTISDAKDFVNDISVEIGDGFSTVRFLNIVFFGTEQGIKDAK